MDRDDLSSRPPTPLKPSYPPPATPAALSAGMLIGVLADLLAVGLFVVIGRHSHDKGDSAAGILSTAWPFAAGVLVGYVPVVPLRWPVTAVRSGLMVMAKTVIIGMLLRAGVQRQGTPVAFILVTVVVLSVFMLGWRLPAKFSS